MQWLFVDPVLTRGACVLLCCVAAMAGSLVTLALLPWIFNAVEVEWLDSDRGGEE